MLNARYIYVHEVLDLGPMWLNRNIRIVSPNNNDIQLSKPSKISEKNHSIDLNKKNEIDNITIEKQIKSSLSNKIQRKELQINHELLEIQCRLFFSINKDKNNKNYLTLILSHSLNFKSAQQSIETSPYKQFLKDFEKIMGFNYFNWKQIETEQNWLQCLNDMLESIKINHIILFSKEFRKDEEFIAILENSQIPLLIFDHPLRIITRMDLKIMMWQQLNIFLLNNLTTKT